MRWPFASWLQDDGPDDDRADPCDELGHEWRQTDGGEEWSIVREKVDFVSAGPASHWRRCDVAVRRVREVCRYCGDERTTARGTEYVLPKDGSPFDKPVTRSRAEQLLGD